MIALSINGKQNPRGTLHMHRGPTSTRCRVPRCRLPRGRGALCLAWFASLALCGAPRAHAEDGYDLWLRYRTVEAPWLGRYRAAARELVPPLSSGEAAEHELTRAIAGMLGAAPS